MVSIVAHPEAKDKHASPMTKLTADFIHNNLPIRGSEEKVPGSEGTGNALGIGGGSLERPAHGAIIGLWGLHKSAIGLLALARGRSQCLVGRGGCQGEQSGLSADVMGVTTPAVVRQSVDEVGFEGVAPDVPRRLEQVRLALDGEAMEAPLPEMAGQPIGPTTVEPVAPLQLVHGAAQQEELGDRHQQVGVIGHETEVRNPHLIGGGGCRQQGAVGHIVLDLPKDRGAAIPPGHHMIVPRLTGLARPSAHHVPVPFVPGTGFPQPGEVAVTTWAPAAVGNRWTSWSWAQAAGGRSEKLKKVRLVRRAVRRMLGEREATLFSTAPIFRVSISRSPKRGSSRRFRGPSFQWIVKENFDE